MKKLFVVGILFLLIGCNSNETNSNKELSPLEQYDKITLLNDSLVNLNPSSEKRMIELGRKIKFKSLTLYNNHQLDFLP